MVVVPEPAVKCAGAFVACGVREDCERSPPTKMSDAAIPDSSVVLQGLECQLTETLPVGIEHFVRQVWEMLLEKLPCFLASHPLVESEFV